MYSVSLLVIGLWKVLTEHTAACLQMVYSSYKKLRILHYYSQGYKPYTISKLLESNEGLKVSRFGVAKFIKHYEQTGAISRKPGSGRPSKVTREIKLVVEEQMNKDDETTAYQLHSLLVSKGYELSLKTILRCRTTLGWTFRGSAYCQLIREANKQKRFAWAEKYKNDQFENVVWTDECTIQLENHRRFCCRKKGQPPKPKPRYVIQILIGWVFDINLL